MILSSNRVTVNPDVCNNKPTIRRMRITVRTILEYLAAGETTENILEAYPYLELADIQASLECAAMSADIRIDSHSLRVAA